MRKSLLILSAAGVAAIAALALPALAETRSFNLSGFDQVSASAGVRVILRQGPYAVSVEEPNGKFDQLELEVRGSKLVAGRKSNNWGWNGRGPEYTITVSAPDYRQVHASSGAHLEGAGLRLADLSVHVSSGAHMELAGACKGIDVDVSSGAHFSGEDLKCQSATASASSGAHVDAFATVSAQGDASSGGRVTFHGSPASFSKDTSSGGSVSTHS